MLAMLSGRLPPRLGEGLLTEGTTCLVTARPLVWRGVLLELLPALKCCFWCLVLSSACSSCVVVVCAVVVYCCLLYIMYVHVVFPHYTELPSCPTLTTHTEKYHS